MTFLEARVSQETIEGLDGRSVLITGASSGLGAQMALQIGKYCHPKTLILSGRNQSALSSIAQECSSTSAKAVQIVTADLSQKESVLALGDRALELADDNTVDVFIHCGGVSSRSDFLETSLEIDERIMQINFFSGAALAKAFVPGMVQKEGGRILWISSVQGLMGIPSRTSYAASKFAVQGYCEALRGELAHHNIQVHCVSPGYIKTNLSTNALRGDGTAHGKLDETTAKGADPKALAVEVLDRAIVKNETDFVVAATLSAKVALWLRFLAPKLLEGLLVKRYAKAKNHLSEERSLPPIRSDAKLD